jgi:hypothetical protein
VTCVDVPGRSGRSGRRGELGLREEQLMLHPLQDRRHVGPGSGKLGGRAPEVGTQLVERPERADARGVLAYAGAAQETGLAAVATAGV